LWALGLAWRRFNKPQEAPVFAHSAGNRVRVLSVVLDRKSRHRRSAATALAISQGLFVAVTAALFVAWVLIAR
jgi:hypothetical protein